MLLTQAENPRPIYQEAARFTIESCQKVGRSPEHALRAVFWLCHLRPDADEALLVATVLHDIERVFQKSSKTKPTVSSDPKELERHQNNSAQKASEFLHSKGVNENFIERVRYLIAKHEVGGDSDQNLLQAVDSISFLETMVDFMINKRLKVWGRDKVREKFDDMFNRIQAPAEATKIAQPFYKQALAKLTNTPA